jgi:hypothetical protein
MNRRTKKSDDITPFVSTAVIVNPDWQCCGSGMFIPDPDFYPSRITDLGSRIQKQQQERGENKFVVIPFYVATNFTKLKIILVLKC